VHDDQLITLAQLVQNLVQRDAGGRGVDQLRSRNQGGRLRQPGREPEGFDLALGLIAGAGAAVEAVAEEVGGLAVQADVSREADIRSLVDSAREFAGPIDLFCLNAGVAVTGPRIKSTSRKAAS